MSKKTLCLNILFTVLILAAATVLAYLFFTWEKYNQRGHYLYSAVVFISRYTDGYVPGIISLLWE